MDMITVSAKTLDEAITKALIELQTTSDHLHYEVIEKGSAGILGIFGSKPCVIRARVMGEEEEKAVKAEAAKAEAARAEAAKAEAAKREAAKAETAKLGAAKREAAKAEAAKVEAAKEKTAKKEAAKPAEVKPAVKTSEKSAERLVEKRAEQPAKTERRERPLVKVDEVEVQKKAKEFLYQVFGAMAMQVTIETSFDAEEGELQVSMTGDDMGILIGKRGQTLDSLQYLLSLVVNKETEGYLRVKLDTENYRKRRKETLETLAKNISYKVKRTKHPVSLEPMNPYERRIIHSALQNDRYVVTRSEGEDPYRHVVISLKREGYSNHNRRDRYPSRPREKETEELS